MEPTTAPPPPARSRRSRRAAWLLPLVAALTLMACSANHDASTNAGGSTRETIETSDGLRLDGRLFAGDPNRLVITLHEYDGDQSDWFAFARDVVQSDGASVLTFDFRGYGASQGHRSTGEGLVTDVTSVVAFARARGYRSVVLIGASMGAAAGIITASEDPSIAAVIVLSPVAHFGGLNVVQALRDRQPPLLLMACEGDVSAVDSMLQIEAAVPLPPADTRLYSGNAHGAAMLSSSSGPMIAQHIATELRTLWPAH